MKQAGMGLGGKLTISAIVLAGILVGSLTWISSYTVSKQMHEREINALIADTKRMADILLTFYRNLSNEAVNYRKMLAADYRPGFEVDVRTSVQVAGKPTPALRNGDLTINNDNAIPDRFTQQTGALATIFVRDGDNFVRISTSLKNDKGERAIGTSLDRNHPAYRILLEDKPYTGMATLFNKPYMTSYEPLKDSSGQVAGVMFVGVEIAGSLGRIKETIKTIKVAETGYYFALSAAAGADYGKLLLHPKLEGQNIIASRDATGREFIREMMEKKTGILEYPWPESEGKGMQDQIAAFAFVPELNWMIAATAPKDEFIAGAVRLRNLLAICAMIALAAMAVALWALIRRSVSTPLKEAVASSGRLAQGDFTENIKTERRDEIGELMHALNDVSSGLTRLVRHVRTGAETIATAASQIAAGSQDLSTRTEEQASSIEETASSMEELASSVRQNAESARAASELSAEATKVAEDAGRAVTGVVVTMEGINDAARRMSDALSVIDGIAFQTNILALNAAVEAARAGEQGRGFAVVAAEVRNLAQRCTSAAREIKTLIDDSAAKTGEGAQRADDAGRRMELVVAAIRRVNDIIVEIAAASREQSDGIDQINDAIAQMDRVTQQNAALVEEASAAVESQRHQSSDLIRSIGAFRLAGERNTIAANSTAEVIPLAAPARQAALPPPAPAKEDRPLLARS